MAIKRTLARFNGHDGKISLHRTLHEVILFKIYSVRTSADMADQMNLADRVKDEGLYPIHGSHAESGHFLFQEG